MAKKKYYNKLGKALASLSLGISIVLAILMGVGLGYVLRYLFKLEIFFWIGVFFGICAAILNVYKEYLKLKEDLDTLKSNPKYKKKR